MESKIKLKQLLDDISNKKVPLICLLDRNPEFFLQYNLQNFYHNLYFSSAVSFFDDVAIDDFSQINRKIKEINKTASLNYIEVKINEPTNFDSELLLKDITNTDSISCSSKIIQLDQPLIKYDLLYYFWKLYGWTKIPKKNIASLILIEEVKRLGYQILTDNPRITLFGITNCVVNYKVKELERVLGPYIPKNTFLYDIIKNNYQEDQIVNAFKKYYNINIKPSPIEEPELVQYEIFDSTFSSGHLSGGLFQVPLNICKLSFALYATAIGYYKFHRVQLSDGEVSLIPLNSKLDQIRPPSFFVKLLDVVKYFNQQMSFQDFVFICTLSSFVQQDVVNLRLTLYSSDHIVYTLICACVLKYKFNIQNKVCRELLWNIVLRCLIKDEIELKLPHGTVIINANNHLTPLATYIHVKKNKTLNHVFGLALKNAENITDLYSIANSLYLYKGSIYGNLKLNEKQKSYLKALILLKNENNLYLRKILERYIKTIKFTPVNLDKIEKKYNTPLHVLLLSLMKL